MAGSALPVDDRNACLARNWRWLLLRGILAIVFAVLVLLQPGLALFSLILLFAAYAIADGIVAIVSAVRAARRHERWGWFVLEGVIGIAAGALAFLLPGIAMFSFVLLAAVWALASGVAMIVAAIRVRRDHGRLWLAVAGLLSVALGVLLFLQPLTGAIVLTLWIGAYALAFGVLLIVAAIGLRRRCADAAPADAA